MKTYREVPVSERLPEFEGIHTVVNADLNMFQAVYDKEFGFHDEFSDCSGITHWLEPIHIPIELYQRTVEKWGVRAQLEMVQEEATELALAVRKYIRSDNTENLKKLASEVADVRIMLEQLSFIFPSLDVIVESERQQKLIRLDRRLSKNIFTE